MPATTAETLSFITRTVSVAPLVLLSAADHFARSGGRNTRVRRRVVGVLLGQHDDKAVRVSNSFAVPFEEDEKDPSVWFLDHNYVESMKDMFKKINAREKLIGWYHTGPKLRASDLKINELFKRYTPNPLLVIIDVQPKEVGVPTDAYFAIEEIKDDGTTTSKTFVHTPSTIEAEEAEEIGVEHLLRDIRDVAVGTLSTRITAQLQSLQGLHLRLRDIGNYLEKVIKKELPINHAILANLQDVFNLLPNLSVPSLLQTASTSPPSDIHPDIQPRPSQPTDGIRDHAPESTGTELARAMSIKTNDQLMTIYLSSLIRAITAFHDLIDNKIQNRQQELDQANKDGKEGEKDDPSKKDATEIKDKDKAKDKSTSQNDQDTKGEHSRKSTAKDSGKG